MIYRDTVILVSKDRILCQLVSAQCEELAYDCRTAVSEKEAGDCRLLLWDADSFPVTAENLPAGAVVITRYPGAFSKIEAEIWERPFSLSRLRERLLTGESETGQSCFTAPHSAVTVDVQRRVAHFSGREENRAGDVALTPSECAVLSLLLARRGDAVSRAEISACLSAEEGTTDENENESGNRIEVHICALRKKLEKADGRHHIFTVRGVGYRFQ